LGSLDGFFLMVCLVVWDALDGANFADGLDFPMIGDGVDGSVMVYCTELSWEHGSSKSGSCCG
jgi:hypothetical protein